MSAEIKRLEREASLLPTRPVSLVERLLERLTGDRVLLLGVMLIALQTAWHADITIGSFFWQDDFRYIASARNEGLTGSSFSRTSTTTAT